MTTTVRRLYVVDQAPAGARVRRSFKHPRSAAVIDEIVNEGGLPKGASTWPESVNDLHIVFVEPEQLGDWERQHPDWLAKPNHAEAAEAIAIRGARVKVRWRPGRAIVECDAGQRDLWSDSLADFLFYEGELRRFERQLEMVEGEAEADAQYAFRIQRKNREHWKLFGAKIERLAQMRLKFARLEPQAATGSRTLPPPARRLFNHLARKADVEARLEAFGDRLEVCEELYEGGSDRVGDYRWYRGGHWLEVAILAFIVLECVIMFFEVYLTWSRGE